MPDHINIDFEYGRVTGWQAALRPLTLWLELAVAAILGLAVGTIYTQQLAVPMALQGWLVLVPLFVLSLVPQLLVWLVSGSWVWLLTPSLATPLGAAATAWVLADVANAQLPPTFPLRWLLVPACGPVAVLAGGRCLARSRSGALML